MCLKIERNKKIFCSVGVFPPTDPMHLISTLSYEQDTLQAKCGGEQLILQISTSEGPEPVKQKIKLKTKTGLAEEGDITIRGIIIRILVFRTNRGINELHKEKSSSKDLQ